VDGGVGVGTGVGGDAGAGLGDGGGDVGTGVGAGLAQALAPKRVTKTRAVAMQQKSVFFIVWYLLCQPDGSLY
jgi:hypothetical protein